MSMSVSLVSSTVVKVFETIIATGPEILQAFVGWYSTLPQCVSENSVEPLDFGGDFEV